MPSTDFDGFMRMNWRQYVVRSSDREHRAGTVLELFGGMRILIGGTGAVDWYSALCRCRLGAADV